MFKLLLLALVPAVLGRIEIRIKAARTAEESQVEALGSSVEIISDQERASFKLGDSQAKQAARNYHGGNADGAYFHSPTPWGDVYSQYGWTPVSRTLVPISAKVVKISSEPTVVARRDFINKSSYRAKYNAAIEESVEQTTSNTWSKSEELTVGQEIEYSVDFGAASVGGKTSMSYSSAWGHDRSKGETITIGSTSGVEVELEPGQAVVSELSAKRGTMEVEVTYVATLDGNVFCNYKEPYLGHYFWRYDVNALLDAARAPHQIVSKEIIKVGFYSDASIVVKDSLGTNSKPIQIAAQNVPIRPKVSLLKSMEGSRVIVPVKLDPKALVSDNATKKI